ncbi:MAG: hypothetical protein RLZZ244_998 [Verrucomicrobiota bacterium]
MTRSPQTRPVALVTGAGTGLGSALAIGLAAQGFDVAIHFRRSAEGAQDAAHRARSLGAEAEVFKADLSQEPEALRLADAVANRFQRLDLLVNNAGVYCEKHGLDLSATEWMEGLHSTVTQTFFTTRAMLPLLRSKPAGRIINLGDSSADRPGARDLAWSYHIGKTGVWMLTRSLAASEAPYGIPVNMVSPGFLENSVGILPADAVPAGRLGTFADLESAVRYLAQEAPAYLTGSNLMVGGGWNLR